LFLIGLIVAVFFNVDTLKIVSKLQRDPKLREQLVMQADAFTKAHPNLEADLQNAKSKVDSMIFSDNLKKDSIKKDSIKKNLDSAYLANKNLSNTLYKRASTLVNNDIAGVNQLLALGWEGGICKNAEPKSIIGWLLTALAISLGAPFWFDLLNKIMRLRGSVATDGDAKARASQK
jgi:hypothetical protein